MKLRGWALLGSGCLLAAALTIDWLTPAWRSLTAPEYLIARRWAYLVVVVLVLLGAFALRWRVR